MDKTFQITILSKYSFFYTNLIRRLYIKAEKDQKLNDTLI